jgi:hypothetical protein
MVDFSNRGNIKRWLDAIQPGTRRREIAVALAARAALRETPLLGLESTQGERAVLSGFVLSSLRATAVSWAAAKYPAHGGELRAAALAAAVAATKARHIIPVAAKDVTYADTAAASAAAALAADASAARAASTAASLAPSSPTRRRRPRCRLRRRRCPLRRRRRRPRRRRRLDRCRPLWLRTHGASPLAESRSRLGDRSLGGFKSRSARR